MISGKAKLAGVIGWPVEHSLSPRLHSIWLNRHNIDGAYIPLSVAPNHLEQTLEALKHMGFRGVNLTLPHKERAYTLMDKLEKSAMEIGAVNTVVFKDGKTIGANTDGQGFYENLKQHAPLKEYFGAKALVLGAGGAAKAVIAGLRLAGIGDILIANRTRERAEELTAQVPGTHAIPWQKKEEYLKEVRVVVNATSLGMKGHEALLCPLKGLKDQSLVADIVYTPLETPLLKEARKLEHRTVEGLGMLVHQAIPGFEAWFGIKPQADETVYDSLRESLKE